mmetsp:Transcript_35375/g.35033  ORF Transcript_35375/g.35033 Transcript_35375/m.35033 type:complete len:106 (-) Transcript_35375:42-359(-)
MNASYLDIVNKNKDGTDRNSLYRVPHKQFKNNLFNHQRAKSNTIAKRIHLNRKYLPSSNMGYPTKENSENSLLTQVRLNKSLSGVYQQFDASSGSRSLQRTTYQK